MSTNSWIPYNQYNLPAEGATVEVRCPGLHRLVAIYDTRWEHGFCNVARTEALPQRPMLWRPYNGVVSTVRPRSPEHSDA